MPGGFGPARPASEVDGGATRPRLARGPADAGTSARQDPQQTSGLQDPEATRLRRSEPPSPWESAAAAAGDRDADGA